MTRTLVRLALLAVVAVGVATPALANDRHYRHDNHGWYDGGGHRHDFIHRNGHRGYWDNHIWIQVD